jgi:hypothetical protein
MTTERADGSNDIDPFPLESSAENGSVDPVPLLQYHLLHFRESQEVATRLGSTEDMAPRLEQQNPKVPMSS